MRNKNMAVRSGLPRFNGLPNGAMMAREECPHCKTKAAVFHPLDAVAGMHHLDPGYSDGFIVQSCDAEHKIQKRK
jgi:hypothetical protein